MLLNKFKRQLWDVVSQQPWGFPGERKKRKESEVTQECPALCDPTDCSLPDFSVRGIFQAGVPEWVAISFSRESSQPRDRTQQVKNPPANSGDSRHASSIPGAGRPPGGGHDNPLQYSCLENPTDRGDWRATVHGVTQSWTGLTNKSSHGGSVAADLRKENEYLLIASECQTWG